VEMGVPLGKGVVVETQSIPRDQRGRQLACEPPFQMGAPDMRRDAFLVNEARAGAMLCIRAEKEIRGVPIAQQHAGIRAERLLELNAIVPVIEDRVVRVDEPMRLESDLGRSPARAADAAHLDRRLPHEVARACARDDGRLAGIFDESLAAGGGELEDVVGVRDAPIGQDGPVRSGRRSGGCKAKVKSKKAKIGPIQALTFAFYLLPFYLRAGAPSGG